MLRSRLVAWRSVAANPSMSPMAIGKNVTSAITTTFGSSPNPNQMINSGAIATIGQRLGRHEQRGQRPPQPRHEVDRDRDRPPDGERHGEPDRRHLQRRHGVGPQRVPVRPALLHHPQRRRQHLRAHARHVDGELPHHEPGQHQRQRGPHPPHHPAGRVAHLDTPCSRFEHGHAPGVVNQVAKSGRVVERLAVGGREHARVVEEAGEARPRGGGLGADLPRRVLQVALGQHLLAAGDELGLGEHAGVGVGQQLGGLCRVVRAELVAALQAPPRTPPRRPGAPSSTPGCR